MLNWFSLSKWARVLQEWTRRESLSFHWVYGFALCSRCSWETGSLPASLSTTGISTAWPRLSLWMPDPGACHGQHGQPSPITWFSCRCTHYTAVCSCNAPINFPFDILRAIYKSCHLSFVPSLMLGNNAAAMHSWLSLSHSRANIICSLLDSACLKVERSTNFSIVIHTDVSRKR